MVVLHASVALLGGFAAAAGPRAQQLDLRAALRRPRAA